MDIVLDKLENTSITPNESNSKTNFDVLYKNWGKLGSQEERRNEILLIQKNNRHNKLDKYRGILDLVESVEEKTFLKFHDKPGYKPSIFVAGFSKVPSYREVLMMSEWLVEKPSDFETDWLVVPAPKATRTLVIASNGITRLVNKYGHLIYEGRTALPGGNPIDPKSRTKCCVLDCFYCKKTNTLYVLDLLAWNSQPMTDGEFEFRDYWMRSQFAELRSIRSINKRNEINFYLLPKVSCAPDSFNSFMVKVHLDNDINSLDGLLFYHKKGHYFSGETPLVGWLFPYMVQEVLGSDITVSPLYMIQKPETYTTQEAFITEFNAKMEKRNKGRGPANRRASERDNEMDTADDKTKTKSEKSNRMAQTTTPQNNTIATDDNPNTESMEADPVPDSAFNEASEETVESKKSEDKKPETSSTASMDAESTINTEKEEISKG